MSEKPTKEELREAIEEAIRWMTMDEDGVLYKRVSPSAAVLRTFLDSGLSDSERETVGKIAEEIWTERHNIGVLAARWRSALAPIAEGK